MGSDPAPDHSPGALGAQLTTQPKRPNRTRRRYLFKLGPNRLGPLIRYLFLGTRLMKRLLHPLERFALCLDTSGQCPHRLQLLAQLCVF
jgi:hypothetical protein